MDSVGFSQIYEQYVDALFTHAYFRVSNREAAKDLVSETFLKAWKTAGTSRDGVKPVENWKAFLYTVLNNLIIDHYRTKKGKDVSLDMMEEGGDEGDGEYGGHTPSGLKTGGLDVEMVRFDTALTSMAVRDAVASLPPLDQQIVTMRFLNDEPTERVAEMMEMTENALYVRSHRALKRLKTLLEGKQNTL